MLPVLTINISSLRYLTVPFIVCDRDPIGAAVAGAIDETIIVGQARYVIDIF